MASAGSGGRDDSRDYPVAAAPTALEATSRTEADRRPGATRGERPRPATCAACNTPPVERAVTTRRTDQSANGRRW